MTNEMPSAGRKQEMDDILWDNCTLRIYCDASQDKNNHLIGIATMFVFDGQSKVFSRKINASLENMNNNMYGEVEAVKFAIQNIIRYLQTPTIVNRPEFIIIYSDHNEISRFVKDRDNIKIEFIGEDRRHNPWYKAAHNAARKEIFLRVKSGRKR